MEKRTDSPYPRRDRPLLAAVGVLLIISTILFARADRVHDWRYYQYMFKGLVAEKLGEEKVASVPSGIQQIWVPSLGNADRCVTCHQGPALGGGMFQKLGLVKPYGTEDPGRFGVTGKESDRGVFKVPSLRNVAQTAPYFHDGSIATLDEAIRIMAEHQLGASLTPEQVSSIRTFLKTLTGRIDPVYTAMPKLPESGPETPAPDPS